ncbi:MAG: ABC transporter ATP-binding protein [Pseudomonadota bacterium]
MNPLLSVAGISCRYEQRIVCTDLAFTVPQGEIACLLGPSGCGKTTVLRAIAGFEPVYSGSIDLAGRTLCSASQALPPEQRQVGMVFQDYALFPHLTVAQNIGFGLHRYNNTERQQITQRMLELMRLQEYADVWPQQLSGGQQQRVALARALAPKPQLLLLDEPFSNLDAELRRMLCSEIRELLKAQGTTAILVTHDQGEAFTMADTVGVMAEGRILQWGTARELYLAPATAQVARFLGHGQLLTATLVSPERTDTALGAISLPAPSPLSPGPVDLLVRPWNVDYQPSSPHRARVVSQSFQGSVTVSTLELADGTRLTSHDEGFALLPLHTETGLSLNNRHMQVFAR